jgi:hypothetical protein
LLLAPCSYASFPFSIASLTSLSCFSHITQLCGVPLSVASLAFISCFKLSRLLLVSSSRFSHTFPNGFTYVFHLLFARL